MNYGNQPVALPSNLLDSSFLPAHQKPISQGSQPGIKPQGQPSFENQALQEDLKKIEYSTKLERLDVARKQKYGNLLRQLQDMGFLDFERNIMVADRVGTEIFAVMEELSKPQQPVAQRQPGLINQGFQP